jgi:hypothetical protein
MAKTKEPCPSKTGLTRYDATDANARARAGRTAWNNSSLYPVIRLSRELRAGVLGFGQA